MGPNREWCDLGLIEGSLTDEAFGYRLFIRLHGGDVAIATRGHTIRNIFSGCVFECFDHFKNTVRLASANVEVACAFMAGRVFYGSHMRARQVDDMNVVALPCPIWGIVIIAKNGKFCT